MALKIHRGQWHKHPTVRAGNQLTFGERAADTVVAGMGSWQFIIWQTAIVGVWILGNVVTLRGIGLPHWDPYPFILLNLVFSTQAAYASPLILMAGNRADKKREEKAELDYETNKRSEEKIDKAHQAILDTTATILAALQSPE
jgi:uncharacterized membrane protein